MADLMEYVRTLSEEIGPRPATTDAEHRASEWIERVMAARGLETESQGFEAIRTYSWAYILYNLLTLASAFAAGFKPFLAWPAFAVSAIVAFFFWTDLDMRMGLTRLMPKGPSQNIIARHVPRARRGEKLRKIVIVAHYDSARASLAFSPNMAKNFASAANLMKLCTLLTPVFVLAMAVPWTRSWEPWLWYVTMAVSAYLLVPLFVNLHREFAMPYVAGANDNASGVAVMLGVMERLVPAPDATSLITTEFSNIRRGPEAAYDAGVVPEGAELVYSDEEPAEATALPEDFSWAEPVGAAESRSQGILEFDTIEFAAVDVPRRSSRTAPEPDVKAEPEVVSDVPVLPADVAGRGVDEITEQEGRRRLFSSRAKKTRRKDQPSTDAWLGVNEDFDARKAGKDIGSWDKFGGDDEDDGFGWKGGWAGDDPIGDPEFAASEAARIRRRVTESIDRELTEKEVWFVATGAKEVGALGMQTFLREYADDLRDALIINLDSCGAGQLFWASAEGIARRYRASARLTGLARRVSRETETLIKPRVCKGMVTDATPALGRGFKAVSIMALGSDGVPPNWHWRTDTADAVDPELLEKTAEFVTAMVRDS